MSFASSLHRLLDASQARPRLAQEDRTATPSRSTPNSCHASDRTNVPLASSQTLAEPLLGTSFQALSQGGGRGTP